MTDKSPMPNQDNPAGHHDDPDQGNADSQPNGIPESLKREHNNAAPNEEQQRSGAHPKPAIPVRIWHALWRKRIFWHPKAGRIPANWAEKVMACVTLALLVVGGIQAYIYWKQSQSMEQSVTLTQQSVGLNLGQLAVAGRGATASQESADVSKQALYAVQRAFITFPPEAEMNPFSLPTGLAYQVTIPIQNTGNTQAHALKDRVSWIPTVNPLPDDYDFPDRTGKYGEPWAATGANIVAAKGQTMSQYVWVDEKTILDIAAKRKDGNSAITRRPRGIIFYGWATYRDIFPASQEHLTEFCRFLSAFLINGKQRSTEWQALPLPQLRRRRLSRLQETNRSCG